ncbi:calcium-binding protein [Nitrosomonas communis]|uniref:calcium-binding protein n=1 Tax=Nitrosomonas communis TaxID=44574 RepID=UPI003D2DEA8D
MAVTTQPRPNLSNSGNIFEIIDGIQFLGFGSGGFSENDLLIIGDETDNVMEGGSGHDEIEGEAGNDTLTGGAGNDTLDGDDGNDVLDGQEDTDKLFGGAGDDILLAGHGHDQLTGGSGSDTFGFYALGHFRVTDFTIGQDRLFFDSEKLGINSLEQLVPFITNINQRTDGVKVEFGSEASIDLVGINLNDITADMVVFTI